MSNANSTESIMVATIIPVYNGAKYILQCCEALKKQEIENSIIVFIDDGSTDDSPQILDQVAKNNQKIYVIHTDNHGVSAARNIGLQYIKEKILGMCYCHFVDIDDAVEPGLYAEILMAIEKSNYPDMVLFGYNSIYLNRSGECTRKDTILPYKEGIISEEELQTEYFNYYGIKTGLRNTLWTKMFKLEVVSNVLFREDLKQAEDLFFSIATLNNLHSILMIRKAYYNYYHYDGSVKNYYDDDIQQAFKRNAEIRDQIIKIGVSRDEAYEEYYHKVLDTAYDAIMLILRSDKTDKPRLIHDCLVILNELHLPKCIGAKTTQQALISTVRKIHSKYLQYLILDSFRRGVSCYRGLQTKHLLF